MCEPSSAWRDEACDAGDVGKRMTHSSASCKAARVEFSGHGLAESFARGAKICAGSVDRRD